MNLAILIFFELYLIFHHGTTPAKETKQFAYGSAMVLLADDLADNTLQKVGSNCIFKFLEKTTWLKNHNINNLWIFSG